MEKPRIWHINIIVHMIANFLEEVSDIQNFRLANTNIAFIINKDVFRKLVVPRVIRDLKRNSLASLQSRLDLVEKWKKSSPRLLSKQIIIENTKFQSLWHAVKRMEIIRTKPAVNYPIMCNNSLGTMENDMTLSHCQKIVPGPKHQLILLEDKYFDSSFMLMATPLALSNQGFENDHHHVYMVVHLQTWEWMSRTPPPQVWDNLNEHSTIVLIPTSTDAVQEFLKNKGYHVVTSPHGLFQLHMSYLHYGYGNLNLNLATGLVRTSDMPTRNHYVYPADIPENWKTQIIINNIRLINIE